MKRKNKIITTALICAFTLCSTSGNLRHHVMADTIETVNTNNIEIVNIINEDCDIKTSTSIIFDDDMILIEGEGAKLEENIVSITTGGTYILSGKSDNAQIIIDATKNDEVRLVIDNLDISNISSSPIYSKKAGKTIIIIADGSNNFISDAQDYIYEEDADEPDATIFSKNDLFICGNGNLTVNANYNNGIGTKDNLYIFSGNIEVNAKNDGMRGRDSVMITDGEFYIKSGNDGIKSNNDNENKGSIIIDGGTFKIVSENDGIQAENNLTINGGSFDIFTGVGSEDAIKKELHNKRVNMSNNDDETSESKKGIKANNDILINNGSFIIDSEDDAIHSNNSITIFNGTFSISTGDDAIHADENLLINDGKIDIITCYEGLESATIDVNGGEINIISSDDAINASDGTASTQMPMIREGSREQKDFDNLENMSERSKDMPLNGNLDREIPNFDGVEDIFDPNNKHNRERPDFMNLEDIPDMPNQNNTNLSPQKTNDNLYIRITGGIISIDSGGDGIDSNGNLYLDGGSIFITGPASQMDNALDSDGVIELNGGLLSAVGGSGMVYSPDQNSTQPSITVYYSETQKIDDTVIVKDENGNIVIEYSPKKDYKSALLSSPEFELNKTYSLYSSDKKLCDIKLENIITIINDDGTENTKNNRSMDREIMDKNSI